MKNNDISVHVNHITRVEGHGNIVLDIKNGKIEQLQWQVVEAPRFFEAMLRGQHFNDLRQITSRICGICSIGHSLASLKATEDALGVKISEQTSMLRRLAIHAENMQSHILHIGYLASPDLFGVGSIIPLVGTKHTDTVLSIVRLHRLANAMSDLLCGRTVHPIRLVVGGFSVVPTEIELVNLRRQLEECKTLTAQLAETIHGVADRLPDFTRETEYIGLRSEDEYALYDGVITSTDTGSFPAYRDYREVMQEYIVPHSTAKFAKHVRESYMVGALARFNINADKLRPDAKKVARMFRLEPVNYNPFMNTIAQLVEFTHSLDDSIDWIDRLIERGIKEEKPVKVTAKAGKGVGIVEVPRGILVHEYTLNSKGYCTKANCVIPTNQNHANIQHDMEKLVPEILDKSEKDIELTLEMLVRAYDPCISCSTHYLDVKFR
jgi:coenzyme F420-reducing hydrogenase alpha subunit